MVAWGGIEPPTQGFSTPDTRTRVVSVSRRNVTNFTALWVSASPFTEARAEGFRARWRNRHNFSPCESTQWRCRPPKSADPMPKPCRVVGIGPSSPCQTAWISSHGSPMLSWVASGAWAQKQEMPRPKASAPIVSRTELRSFSRPGGPTAFAV